MSGENCRSGQPFGRMMKIWELHMESSSLGRVWFKNHKLSFAELEGVELEYVLLVMPHWHGQKPR